MAGQSGHACAAVKEIDAAADELVGAAWLVGVAAMKAATMKANVAARKADRATKPFLMTKRVLEPQPLTATYAKRTDVRSDFRCLNWSTVLPISFHMA